MPRTILVVDDDDDIRDSLAEALEAEGYVVVTAANGVEALARLRTGMRPDAILLDMVMAVMDGRQFVRALERDLAITCVPVVVISADDRAQLPGAAAFVRKPFELESLLGILERVCEGAGGLLASPGRFPA